MSGGYIGRRLLNGVEEVGACVAAAGPPELVEGSRRTPIKEAASGRPSELLEGKIHVGDLRRREAAESIALRRDATGSSLGALGLLFALILFLLVGCKKDQVGADSDFFIKYYGGPEVDAGNDVRQLADGGYLLLGTRATEQATQEILLIRTDTAGNQVEERVLGTGMAGKIVPLAAGGYVVVGAVDEGLGTTDILLVGLDADGKTEWTSRIGVVGVNEVGVNGIERQDGGLAVVGWMDDGFGQRDAKVVLTSAVGVPEIEYSYGFPDKDEIGVAMVEVKTSVFLICGDGDGNTTGRDLFALSIIAPQQSIDQVWRWQLGGSQEAVGLSTFGSGNYLVLGNEPYAGSSRLVQAVWDPVSLDSLRPNQAYSFGIADGFVASGLRTRGTEVYVAGQNTSDDFALVVLDSTGVRTLEKNYPGKDDATAEMVATTADSGYALFGTLSRAGTGMMMLVKDR